jgi:hypothetical protein
MAFSQTVDIEFVTTDIDTPITGQGIFLRRRSGPGEREQGNQDKDPQCGYRRSNHSIAVMMRLMMMQVVIGK